MLRMRGPVNLVEAEDAGLAQLTALEAT